MLNFRLLPGDSAASVTAHVRQVIADERIEIKLLDTPFEPSRSHRTHGHLPAIHANLGSLFPQSCDLAWAWLSTPNDALGGLAPVAFARDEGAVGLRMRRLHLDHATDVRSRPRQASIEEKNRPQKRLAGDR